MAEILPIRLSNQSINQSLNQSFNLINQSINFYASKQTDNEKGTMKKIYS